MRGKKKALMHRQHNSTVVKHWCVLNSTTGAVVKKVNSFLARYRTEVKLKHAIAEYCFLEIQIETNVV